jgi:hypothetical protein
MTGSDATVEHAVQWLRDCVKHEKCTYRHDRRFPTRILDIGDTQSDTIILREPLNQSGCYICLSYCWGGARFIKTTRQNIGDHKKGIPWEALPKTFQDAIQVTRLLGIWYIWIDALCIVQDDYEDWERQAGRMATIYQNSFITIAATSAISPNAGLFSSSEKFELGSVYVQLIHHFPNSVTNDEKEVFPLLKRAWAYRRCWGEPSSYSGLSYDALLIQCPLPKQPLFETLLTPPIPRRTHASSSSPQFWARRDQLGML